jgi:hypothetical protein
MFAGLVKEVSACIIVDVFKCANPVEQDGIQLDGILFVGIIKVEEVKDTDIPFLIVLDHFARQAFEIGGEFGIDRTVQSFLGKRFLERGGDVLVHGGLGIVLGSFGIGDE